MEKVKTSIERYWNWRSKSFGYDTDKSIEIAKTWEAILKKIVSGAPGKRALDIGTGRGQLAFYLARFGFSVTGIDLSENMISHARQYATAHNLDINFQTGDAEELEFEDKTFDVVVSDGLWMNYTWKCVHLLALNLFKRMFRNGSMISARFFLSYASLYESLPFYEGICFEKASMLLEAARFKDIKSYDTSCFGTNPYGDTKRMKNTKPSFFIAYGRR